MKLMFLITGLGVGGAERQVVDLTERLSSRGHQIVLVYLTGEAKILPANSAVRVYGLAMRKSPSGVIAALWRLRKIVVEYRPDVLHSHMVHANVTSRLLRLLVRIPLLVCTAHNTYEGGWLRMLAYRMTDQLADITTNVSQEAVLAFEAAGAVRTGRMIAVTNGIDVDRFREDLTTRAVMRANASIPPGTKIVLAVGRLAEAKDYPNLLKACRIVFEKVPEAMLWIAGGGDLEDDLKAMAIDLGVVDRVHFLGVRSDIPALMNAADVFALPSAWEGFGLVVAEAMACGKVVVATDSGGVKEVLGDCGFLVPPRDCHAFADALIKAIEMSDQERKLAGDSGRYRIERLFSLDSAVDRWSSIYRSPPNVSAN